MRYFTSFSISFTMILLLSCSTNNKNSSVNIESINKVPNEFIVKISPEGNNLIIVKDYNTVLIKATSDTIKRQLLKFEEEKVNQVCWKSEDLLLFLTVRQDSIYFIYKFSLATKELTNVYESKGQEIKILDELPMDENYILLGITSKTTATYDLFRFNHFTKECNLVAKNDGTIIKWISDINGKLRAVRSENGVKSKILFKENENSEFKVVAESTMPNDICPVCFTEDNQNLLVLSNTQTDKLALFEYDLNKKKIVSQVFKNAIVDLEEEVLLSKTGKLLAVHFYTWRNEYEFFSAENKERFSNIQKRLKNYDVEILDYDNKFENLILKVYNEKTHGFIYSFNHNNEALEKLCDLSPWINEQEMADTKSLDIPTKDSLLITGYLTVPKDASLDNLPILVKINSIVSREKYYFDGEAQYFAKNGFAVLKINHRGKTGLGLKFFKAGFKQFSGDVCDDIKISVDWLVDQGIANPAKISIFGKSLGGLVALNSVIRYPDFYRSCVSMNGIINLNTFYENFPSSKTSISLGTMILSDTTDKEIRQNSPFYNFMQIKTPLLIINGDKDKFVDKRELKKMIKGLEFLDVKVDYLYKEDEGHVFAKSKNRIKAYSQTIDFLNNFSSNKKKPSN